MIKLYYFIKSFLKKPTNKTTYKSVLYVNKRGELMYSDKYEHAKVESLVEEITEIKTSIYFAGKIINQQEGEPEA